MVKISAEKVRRLAMSVPSPQEQGRILNALARASERIDSERRHLDKLRTLKHGIMDDLPTGRVRVTVPGEATA